MRNYQREQSFPRRQLGMKWERKVTSHRKAKSLVGKVFSKEKLLVIDPKKILGVIEGFYSGVYTKDDLEPSENLMNTFLENPLMSPLFVDDSQV